MFVDQHDKYFKPLAFFSYIIHTLDENSRVTYATMHEFDG
jgi:hypothetical protein